jgi:hypothetical protein
MMTEEQEKRIQRDILWRYLDEESDALLLELRERVEKDGFTKAMPTESPDALTLNLLIILKAKLLILMCERVGHPNAAKAYMDVVLPQEIDILKHFIVRQARQQR